MDVLPPAKALAALLAAIETEQAARRMADLSPVRRAEHLDAIEKLGAAKARAHTALRFETLVAA